MIAFWIQGYQSGAFYLNLGPDVTKTKVNVVTHEQVREALASQPEPEDVAPATFEEEVVPEPEAKIEVAATSETTEAISTDSNGKESESSDQSEGEVQSQDPVSDLVAPVADISIGESSDAKVDPVSDGAQSESKIVSAWVEVSAP